MNLGRQAFSTLTVALLATAGSLAAQSAENPQEEQQAAASQEQTQQQDPSQSKPESKPAAPAPHSGPSLAGTIVSLDDGGFSLQSADGKRHKVAVNPDTEQRVQIVAGAKVIVDYRRKVGGFVIAQRIRPAEETTAADAAPAAAAPEKEAPAAGTPSLTAEVVSWNDSALVVKTKEGEVTFFLSPTTEYLVKSLDPGVRVIVEYNQGADGARMATRVRPAQETQATKKDGR